MKQTKEISKDLNSLVIPYLKISRRRFKQQIECLNLQLVETVFRDLSVYLIFVLVCILPGVDTESRIQLHLGYLASITSINKVRQEKPSTQGTLSKSLVMRKL